MSKKLTKTQAEAAIVAKVDRAWVDRDLELFRTMTDSQASYTTVSGLRICGDWPHRGSIAFTRDADGKKCKLFMTKRSWRAVAK